MTLDIEKAKKNIEVILNKVHNDTDLTLLREYRKIFKKEISLFSRRWAAAWLLMYYDQKEIPNMQSMTILAKAGNKNAKDEKSQTVILAENETKKLFISIGKNRRLFPREVITLIMSKTDATREDIGVIRILDNYSFVQVRDSKADDIIKALNGIKFRSKTLAVDYAKPKTNDE
jgi:transcriptional regulator of heat shock response